MVLLVIGGIAAATFWGIGFKRATLMIKALLEVNSWFRSYYLTLVVQPWCLVLTCYLFLMNLNYSQALAFQVRQLRLEAAFCMPLSGAALSCCHLHFSIAQFVV